MRLTASDFHTYYRPSLCDLRVYLRAHNEPGEAPSPYEQLIQRLGNEHELRHLQTFPSAVNISLLPQEEQEGATSSAIAEQAPVIYQPVLTTQVTLDGQMCELLGRPDFLLWDSEGYVIRDVKMARQITFDDHPEIIRQLQFYGWLYEQMHKTATRLEVLNGAEEIVTVPNDGYDETIAELKKILSLKLVSAAPYSPVGWSKCGGCCFNLRCMTEAQANKDVALVSGIDQNLASVLRQAKVFSIDQLLNSFDETTLSEFRKPVGTKLQRVGKRAEGILRMAKVMHDGSESIFGSLEIPYNPNYVMFDLEGIPPQFKEIEKIYLWGMQVFGDKPSSFMPALAGFGPNGDQEGWFSFLKFAQTIFDEYGDLHFVHWSSYERTKLDSYVRRYGDVDGVAARVRQNLLDLYSIVQNGIALPIPSYSLKVIEKYIGFTRTQDEYGGDWSIAKYIEATELEDVDARNAVLDQILTYNKEDLEATRAVLQWLQNKAVSIGQAE